MGIVIDQSIKNTLSTYLGFAIGAINTLVFYTNFMSATNYGIIALLLSIATLVSPFMLFGSHQMLIRFYPKFNDYNRGELVRFSLVIPVLMSLLIGAVLYFNYDRLVEFIQSESVLPENFLWYVYSIGIFMAFFEYFYALSRASLKSVLGNFAKEVFHRFLISMGLIALYFKWLGFEEFIVFLLLIYGVRLLLMVVYSLKIHQLNYSKTVEFSKKPLLRYAFIMLMGSAAALVILEVDKVMINMYLDLDQVAYYTVAVFVATLVGVPFRAMHQITLPITANFIANQDFKGLRELYKMSSLNLSVVTGLVLVLLLVNLEGLYSFIPQDYAQAMYVVYILGIAKFMDASLGINNSIIVNAPFYGYVLAFGVLLAILTILFNSWLLPLYGIVGAAYASLAALMIYNLLKLILVIVNYKIHPYSKSTLIVVVLSFLIYFLVINMSISNNVYLNMLLKSLVTVFVYLGVSYKIKLSSSINQLIDKYFLRT